MDYPFLLVYRINEVPESVYVIMWHKFSTYAEMDNHRWELLKAHGEKLEIEIAIEIKERFKTIEGIYKKLET